MTDEELAARLRDVGRSYGMHASPNVWIVLAATARALLAKPTPTREAVEKRLEDSPVNAAWNNNTVLQIMDALSHFAPPASNAPILGMSQAEIEAEMYIRMEAKRKNMEGVLYVQECARVAHRLAQLVPDVDETTERAKELAWEHAVTIDYRRGQPDKDMFWVTMYPPEVQKFWRKQATADKCNG